MKLDPPEKGYTHEWVETYESFVEKALARWGCDKKNINHRGTSSKTTTPKSRWDFGAGWNGAVNMIRDGWADGAEMIADINAEVSEARVTQQAVCSTAYDIAGGIPDIGRAMSGAPDSFMDFVDGEKAVQFCKIAINIDTSAGVGAEIYKYKGMAVAALIDALENQNIRVHLDVVVRADTYSGKDSSVDIELKKFDEPLDMSRIAFVIAHPAFFRRLWFAFIENNTREVALELEVGGRYGSPADMKSYEIESGGYDFYFGKSMLRQTSDFETPEKAAEWVDRKVKEYNEKEK